MVEKVDWEAKEKRTHKSIVLGYCKDLAVADKIPVASLPVMAEKLVKYIWGEQ